MTKRISCIGACVLIFLSAFAVFATDNSNQEDQIQIQNATTPNPGFSSNQMNTPFSDQLRQMHDMQQQMNASIKNTFNDPFFSQGAFNSSSLRIPQTHQSNYPQMKYFVKDNNYVVQFIIPGMSKKDIKIELNNNVLKVSGKTETSENNSNDRNQSSYSCTNEFMQSIRVPDDADTSKITSNYNNGVLTISIPKNTQKESKPQIIPIS